MTKTMATLKPAELFREIQRLCAELEEMALLKAPAPVKPKINADFNPSLREGSQMRQRIG